MRSMKWTALFVLMLLTAGLTAQAADDEQPSEYIEVDPVTEIESFRWFVSPVVEDTLHVRIEGPAGGVGHTAHLKITLEDQQATASIPLEAQRDRDDQVTHATGGKDIDLSDWPDGQAKVEIAVDWPKRPPTDLFMRDDKSFRIVREHLAAAPEPHRGELRTWIADHARQKPIWGKIPAWPNLDAALNRAAEGEDPYSDLRRFMLRAYHNPQLRRMQPYTVYVPEALDLDEPAPLLILLHGSGGDYRNLVADYAAGQRFEDQPMLIANAGAFAHQEFRHLALNDVRWIIEDMKRKYNVDADRIYCQGISLGGRGVIELAARMPNTFAAVSAQGVYGIHPTLINPADMLQRDRLAVAIEAEADIRSLLPAMAHVPTEIIFGWQDETTPPANALLIHKVMQHTREPLNDAAGDLRLRGFDTGHNISIPDYDWASTRRWMLEHRRSQTERKPPVQRSKVGPIWTVWNHPVIYVYDDRGDDAITDRLKRSAERSAGWDMTFGSKQLPVSAMSELNESDRKDHALILFVADADALPQDMTLPWPDDDDALKQRLAAADVRVALRPGPGESDQSVLVVVNASDRPVSLREFGWWDKGFYTDWVVGRAQADRRGRQGVAILAGGFFDGNHQPTDRYTTEDWRGPGVMR